MQVIDPRELNDLAAFAARGGLGHGIAVTDCVAELPDQLMYLTGDSLVLLRDLGPILLASCEGVVGWIRREDVQFDRLASSSLSHNVKEHGSPANKKNLAEEVPRTVIVSPSPPSNSSHLPSVESNDSDLEGSAGLGVDRGDDKRVSNPFDFDSPIASPTGAPGRKGFEAAPAEGTKTSGQIEEDGQEGKRESVDSVASSEFGGIGGFMMGAQSEDGQPEMEQLTGELSCLSTYPQRRIGFRDDSPRADQVDETPSSQMTISTPQSIVVTTPAEPASAKGKFGYNSAQSPTSIKSAASTGSWDIYDTYARESTFGAPAPKSAGGEMKSPKTAPLTLNKPKSPTALRSPLTPPRAQLRIHRPISEISRDSIMSSGTSGSWDDEGGAFEAARLALEKIGKQRQWVADENAHTAEKDVKARQASGNEPIRQSSDSTRPDAHDKSDGNTERPPSVVPARPARRRPLGMDMPGGIPDLQSISPVKSNPETPKAPARAASPIDTPPAVPSAKAMAMEIRNRSEQQSASPSISQDPVTPVASGRAKASATDSRPSPPAIPDRSATPKLTIANPDEDGDDNGVGGEDQDSENTPPSTRRGSEENHESDVSTEIITPNPPTETIFAEPTEMDPSASVEGDDLDALPPKRQHVVGHYENRISKVEPIVAKLDPRERAADPQSQVTAPGPPKRSTSFAPPVIPAASAWNPSSPSSPHSVAATRQAVEAVRKTPEGKRPRNLTLVGRMDADLTQAKGPVPITFLIGNPPVHSHTHPHPHSHLHAPGSPNGVGLGLPPLLAANGRVSPIERRATSPLAPSPVALAPPFIEDPVVALKTTPSPYPTMPSHAHDLPPAATPVSISPPGENPKPGFFPRPRSRSFSAAMNRALSKKKSNPNLTINTDIPAIPAVPSDSSSFSASTPVRRPFFNRQSSVPESAPTGTGGPPRPSSPAITLSPDIIGIVHSNASSPSLHPPSTRSSSFTFNRKGSKVSKGPMTSPVTGTRPLASPVSNKDYEDTVKADGLDFEIIQPKRANTLLSPSSISLETGNEAGSNGGADLERKGTVISSLSGRSLKTLPDTDEWGFIKDSSPTPEIFSGRAGGAGQRQVEQKWLGMITAPLPIGTAIPKKVRKLAVESGVPASLRGRVWAWFMSSTLSARRPGLYQELLDHDRNDPALAAKIDADVESAYPDHSIYSETSTGQSDLRAILRAYSHFATGGYRSEMSLIAGMLLIHCVAEDAFWLLSGFVNGVLKDYYASPGPNPHPASSSTGANGNSSNFKPIGLRVDAAVFAGVLAGSEPKLAKLFRDIGLHPIAFMEIWYTRLFIRCLPWPTALRIIDAVIAEGPRFLLIASLTVLTLSRDRILALPKTYKDVLSYLRDLPQDALFLPEVFMKACENVRFKDEDMKRLRAPVEKELGMA